MKQFRDTDYWVSKDEEVFRYWPERYSEWEIVNMVGNLQKRSYYKPERWNILKSHQIKGKYWYVTIHINGKPKGFTIHRLVAELYVPGYFEGAHIDHIDNNPSNNHYTNLQWCTPEYNYSKGNKLTFPLYSEWSK